MAEAELYQPKNYDEAEVDESNDATSSGAPSVVDDLIIVMQMYDELPPPVRHFFKYEACFDYHPRQAKYLLDQGYPPREVRRLLIEGQKELLRSGA